MEIKSSQTVTFINGLKEADVWILADTEANRKTTVWGTATISKAGTNESREAPLCEPGDSGLFMLRMIDTDHFFYSANGIAIEAGWTLRIEGGDMDSVVIKVTDGDGALSGTYEVFAARL